MGCLRSNRCLLSAVVLVLTLASTAAASLWPTPARSHAADIADPVLGGLSWCHGGVADTGTEQGTPGPPCCSGCLPALAVLLDRAPHVAVIGRVTPRGEWRWPPAAGELPPAKRTGEPSGNRGPPA